MSATLEVTALELVTHLRLLVWGGGGVALSKGRPKDSSGGIFTFFPQMIK